MLNNSFFDELYKRYHENKLAHAFLIETNDLDKCHKDLINFIKKISCKKEFSDECDDKECNLCTLIDNNNLPSLIDIYPDGTQIKKEQIHYIMDKFETIPVFNEYNIYIINECDKLNRNSCNALLKFLEEPEDSILGFLITKNKMSVLTTVRSRCQEGVVYYESNNNDLTNIEKIIEYLNNIYNNKDDLLYNKTTAINYFSERSEWISFFTDMFSLFNNLVKNNNNSYNIELVKNINREKIVRISLLIETVLNYLISNVNIDLVLDKFVIEMRDIYA